MALGNSSGELIQVDLRNSERALTLFWNHKKGSLLDVSTNDGLDGFLLTFESGNVAFLNHGSSKFAFDITKEDAGLNRINSLIWSANNIDYHVVSGSNHGMLNHWVYNGSIANKTANLRDDSVQYDATNKSAKLSDDIINNVQYDATKDRLVCGTNSGRVHVLEKFTGVSGGSL